jgi:hemolysin D
MTIADVDKKHALALVQQVLTRCHDPLQLMTRDRPVRQTRIILKIIALLVVLLLCWAMFGKLDIIVSAEGKLVPKTLLKIVQPAEPGVIQALLVHEGDHVVAGQVLARLDKTLASADKLTVASELAVNHMQLRRINAELNDQPMLMNAGDDNELFGQVLHQYQSHRQVFLDSRDQEKSLLSKAENEYRSAREINIKLERSLPSYRQSANAYQKLQDQGFFSPLAAQEKQREAAEKAHDLQAQKATVSALADMISAQKKRLSQIDNNYRNELEKERAEVKLRIAQLELNLDKSLYREGLMALKAPQDGVIKDLSTTTVGSVVQPGSVVMTLVPVNEPLYADVQIDNTDVGFVREGQCIKVKLVAYPFQKYGMLSGKVIHISPDATSGSDASQPDQRYDRNNAGHSLTYKARVLLDQQSLKDREGRQHTLTAGMQVVSEIHQGRRTVMEYLLSPVQKTLHEAGRER